MKSLDEKVLILWSLPHEILLYVYLKMFICHLIITIFYIFIPNLLFSKTGKILLDWTSIHFYLLLNAFLFTFQCNPSSTSITLNPPLSCFVSINPFFQSVNVISITLIRKSHSLLSFYLRRRKIYAYISVIHNTVNYSFAGYT